jgi:hypothetical protein
MLFRLILILVLGYTFSLGLAASAQAQDAPPAGASTEVSPPASTPSPTPEPTPTPPPLPSSSEGVQPYLGNWAVTSSFQGNPVSADIELKDEDGFVAGTFKMAFLPQPQPIDYVVLTEEGIALTTKLQLGQNPITLTLRGSIEDGKFIGTIKDAMGLMSSDFQAVKSDPELDPYMGSWLLDAAGQEEPIRVDLYKIDGQPTGFVTATPEAYPTAIEAVSKTDTGLDLGYDVNLPTGRVEVTMSIRREGEGVAGSFRENTGKFSDEFTGVPTVPDFPTRYASDLDVTGFESYLGPWTLASSFQGNAFNLDLQLFDVGGKLGGVIKVPLAPEPMVLKSMTRQDDALVFSMDLDFGGPRFELSIEARMADGKLAGRLFDSSGFFDAEFTSRKAKTDGIAIARAIASADGVESFGGRRGRPGSNVTARLNLGDQQLRAIYRPIATTHADYEAFLAVKPGEVFKPTSARVTKFYTDVDLNFGGIVIPAHNFTEDYPGVYGLWLKETSNGYNLVFNEQGDAWGTMHDPMRDVNEVPLSVAEREVLAEEFSLELLAEGSGGLLQIAWGNLVLSAPFDVQ